MDIRSSMAMLGYKKTQPLVSNNAAEKSVTVATPQKSSFQDAYRSEIGTAKPNYNQPSNHQFTKIIGEMAQNAIGTLKQSEATSYAGLSGKADAQAVVQAMANAEMTLKAALSIRDKVVEAYQEILKMPI